jgi:hypothetical protein
MVAWLMSLWDNDLPVFFGLSLFGLGSLAMQRSIGGKTLEIPPKGGTTNGLCKFPWQYMRLPILTRPSFCQIPPTHNPHFRSPAISAIPLAENHLFAQIYTSQKNYLLTTQRLTTQNRKFTKIFLAIGPPPLLYSRLVDNVHVYRI